MANGYDEHSVKMTGVKEAASSSDAAPMVAVRDRRFTRSGIGFRSQEATTLAPGQMGQTPPPIMYTGDYFGGTATRKRGQVDEAKLPWETAQEATDPQVRPREALPPWGNGMNEALPPWLQKDKNDEEKESLPPWLQKDDEKKASGKGGMKEAADDDDIGGFPDEEDAREALEVLSQFVDGDVVSSLQDAIKKQYGEPKFAPSTAGDDEGDDDEGPWFMGEAAMKEKPLNANKRNNLDSSDFALPGRKYPIDTPERARSALARVKQFGSPEDQRKVKAAVQKKYPSMKVD